MAVRVLTDRFGTVRRLRAVLLASSAIGGLLYVSPAHAQDATWLATPGTGSFNTAANWDTATVPTGTAFFGASDTTSLSFSTHTLVGGLTFNAGASAYTFTNDQTVQFNGAGIVVNGGSAAITNNDRNGLLLSSTPARPAAPPS